MTGRLTRREFVAAAGGAAGMALLPGLAGAAPPRETPEQGAVVLLQGDSITDCGRDRERAGPNDAAALGNGYALLLAAALLHAHPERGLRIYNRGVSGDRVPDLQARWDADALHLRPDIVSVLIGVNDFWHTRTHDYKGSVDDYAGAYADLLHATRRAMPEVRIVVMEPFVLRTGVVDASWSPEFDERRAVAARVAADAGADFVPLQAMFDQLAARTGPEYWAADGVHPTPAGHAAIAERWRDAVGL